MSYKTWRELIKEIIIKLGGKAILKEIRECVEKDYKDYIKDKSKKSWNASIRHNLATGCFEQKRRDKLKMENGAKFWYINEEKEEECVQESQKREGKED